MFLFLSEKSVEKWAVRRFAALNHLQSCRRFFSSPAINKGNALFETTAENGKDVSHQCSSRAGIHALQLLDSVFPLTQQLIDTVYLNTQKLNTVVVFILTNLCDTSKIKNN